MSYTVSELTSQFETKAVVTRRGDDGAQSTANAISSAQRSSRLAFLEREGIELFGGPQAGAVARTPAFQEAFNALAKQQGRGDAALAAFARGTGKEAITANSKLVRFISNSVGASKRTRHIADSIRIRDIRK